jgi:DNA-binding NarL/FixJ family response regulator
LRALQKLSVGAGVKRLAGTFPIHEINDRHALIYLLEDFKPTVLFLDYEMAVPRKMALQREIIQESPSLRVVVFTSNPTLDEGVAAIKSGTKGYGPKNLSKSLLRKAADVVSRGELWIGRDLVPVLIEELVRHSGKGASSVNSRGNGENSSRVVNGLSSHERQIASLIATGKHNKAISGHLNISKKTVKDHLTVIFKKLGVSSRTQLALAISQSSASHKYSNLRPSAKAALRLSRIEHH